MIPGPLVTADPRSLPRLVLSRLKQFFANDLSHSNQFIIFLLSKEVYDGVLCFL